MRQQVTGTQLQIKELESEKNELTSEVSYSASLGVYTRVYPFYCILR